MAQTKDKAIKALVRGSLALCCVARAASSLELHSERVDCVQIMDIIRRYQTTSRKLLLLPRLLCVFLITFDERLCDLFRLC